MRCDKCDNEANFEIHLIGGSGKKTVRLCKDCYMNYMNEFLPDGEFGEENFKYFQDILSDLIGSIIDKNLDISKIEDEIKEKSETEKNSDKRCSNCGMSLPEIVKSGKIGCSQCYEDFESEVGKILTQTQGKSEHKGKVPKKYEGLIVVRNKIEKKEEELQELITSEDYENAALIRDEIKELKIDLENINGKIND